jgi:hypothetical protein
LRGNILKSPGCDRSSGFFLTQRGLSFFLQPANHPIENSMHNHARSFLTLFAACAVIWPMDIDAKTPKAPSPMPDLVIEKTTQTSSDFWMVKVRNVGKADSAATTLKMVATPGGAYSCPVAPIKAGGTADVPCKMPFKARAGMRCEFILNPEKSITEGSYANNRTVSATNPKYN